MLVIGTGAYGGWRLRDTRILQPGLPTVKIDLSSDHPAVSPIMVTVRLLRLGPSDGGPPGSQIRAPVDNSDYWFPACCEARMFVYSRSLPS